MKLTYVFHSGFVVEGGKMTVVFDYYRDSDNAYVHRGLASFPGRMYVLVSHWHPDHFRDEVLQWKQQRPDIRYIFSDDILQKYPAYRSDADYVAKGQTWADDILTVKVFGSTDVGVSFLVEAEGKRFFHAGDLNNWHWKEESTAEEVRQSEEWFLKEVADIRQETDCVDAAMFPVDPRLGKDYMLGAEQFVDRIRCGLFSPMHFGLSYAEANAFQPYAVRAGCRFAAWHVQGESVEF
ncbi:MAG: MBL fold metallo-hydrolase [Tannerella sp.]|jgi:L-ascorbate metabolism protein UlaG (beta-lactamase superfamily)|nr:MBL fold metallo-hydrolase [Tannerella sp.]